jgi:hypothetical protein
MVKRRYSGAKGLLCGCAGLEEVYKGAVSSSIETREELDGLLNLINRLDFNKFFTGGADYCDLLEQPNLSSRAL